MGTILGVMGTIPGAMRTTPRPWGPPGGDGDHPMAMGTILGATGTTPGTMLGPCGHRGRVTVALVPTLKEYPRWMRKGKATASRSVCARSAPASPPARTFRHPQGHPMSPLPPRGQSGHLGVQPIPPGWEHRRVPPSTLGTLSSPQDGGH